MILMMFNVYFSRIMTRLRMFISINIIKTVHVPTYVPLDFGPHLANIKLLVTHPHHSNLHSEIVSLKSLATCRSQHCSAFSQIPPTCPFPHCNLAFQHQHTHLAFPFPLFSKKKHRPYLLHSIHINKTRHCHNSYTSDKFIKTRLQHLQI